MFDEDWLLLVLFDGDVFVIEWCYDDVYVFDVFVVICDV